MAKTVSYLVLWGLKVGVFSTFNFGRGEIWGEIRLP
jgi:hypothetical protein